MLPDLTDLLTGLRVVRIPLRVRFRGLLEREVALIRGPRGWGEFGPFPEYAPAEAATWLAATVEAAYVGWPAPLRSRIPVNATVPAVPPEQVADVLTRFPGCTTAKVKVAQPGQRVGDDVDRVAAVRDALGRHAAIRVDANGGWDLADATSALTRLAQYDLEYAEQPCADVADLARLRVRLAARGLDVPVAADESIRRAADPTRVARLKAADLIVVKVAPLGGVASALRIVEQCGLPAVVSSALDTSIGMAAGVALAAALPQLRHACGLGTVELLAGDVTTPSVAPQDGWLSPQPPPSADPDLVQRWEAPADRIHWWRARLESCHHRLAMRGVR